MAVTISGDGTITGRTPDAGEIVQVVHASNQNNNASSGGLDNAIQAITIDITPKYANSMMVILYHATAVGDQDTPFATWIERSGTKVGVESTSNLTYASVATTAGSAAVYSDGDAPDTVMGHCTDSPNTTSPITYEVWIGNRRDSTIGYRLSYSRNYGMTTPDSDRWQLSATQKITVMEVKQ